MKKNILRVLVYSALGTALALALSIAPPAVVPPVDAAFSQDCFCDLGQATQIRWGLGSTCAASLADLDAQASADYQAAAPNVCDPPCGSLGRGIGCDPQLIVTGSCTWNPSYQKFVTDGYYSYGCFTCP